MDTRWWKAIAMVAAAGASAAVIGKALRRVAPSGGPEPGALRALAGSLLAPEDGSLTKAPAPPVEDPAVSAREAAILHAYDVVSERAGDGERVEILELNGVRVLTISEGAARVAVPLYLSVRTPDRVPRTERIALHVDLERASDTWQAAGHYWDAA